MNPCTAPPTEEILKPGVLFEGKDAEKNSTDEGSCKCHPYDLNVVKMH